MVRVIFLPVHIYTRTNIIIIIIIIKKS